MIQDWKGDDDKDEDAGPEYNVIIGGNSTENNHFDAYSVLTAHSASDYSSSSNEEPDYQRMVKKLRKMMKQASPDQKAGLQDILDGKSPDRTKTPTGRQVDE